MFHVQPRLEFLVRAMAETHSAPERRVRFVRAPYRICPLGAHIDHQLGPVTAMAIDQSVVVAFVPSQDRSVRLTSLDFPGVVEFHLDQVPPRQADDWGNYARGAATALLQNHSLDRGILGVVWGQLHGGGVSSSAALGVALLLALEAVNGLEVSPIENVALDRAIENGYLGLRNGILDQAAILLSRRGHLTLIDCASARHELIPAPASLPPLAIVLAFSGLSSPLVATDYNRRVDECAQAARVLLAAAGRDGTEPILGNVTPEEYAMHGEQLVGALARRAAHFFSETARVGEGIEAWSRGDLERFGALMSASGASSIVNYECGSPPLVALRQILLETEGVLGARFSGAGFRGCCVALVRPRNAAGIEAGIHRRYAAAFPELAAGCRIVCCGTDDGAGIVDAERGER